MSWRLAAIFWAAACWAQQYELGGAIGYGSYRNGTIFGSAGTVTAGIRNRFAAGAVLGEDLYEHLSGEFRWVYHDGHPFLQGAGTKTDMQGESDALVFDLLFHFKPRDRRIRPFIAAGAGAKDYIVSGPEPFPQPIPAIASLVATDEWHFLVSLGGGVKYRLQRHVILRADFRDYLTTFPKRQLMPAPHGTARGIFQQFTPLFGVSYVF
ncbi:MAG: outer membrane beta-barrel protein [Acidobacteriia bacterium]|nr:outer membrane beta-barrel protein [Terriglobia bacterium]